MSVFMTNSIDGCTQTKGDGWMDKSKPIFMIDNKLLVIKKHKNETS